ncbi:hypothetical protein GCM10010302_65810 [Streptomyces polychromogenes]|uniref:Uncharacterized protein n=1 Tax=Streptomyces polychromogenes TaxID=67342 RepID=A0ABP3FGP4_9ACTN
METPAGQVGRSARDLRWASRFAAAPAERTALLQRRVEVGLFEEGVVVVMGSYFLSGGGGGSVGGWRLRAVCRGGLG